MLLQKFFVSLCILWINLVKLNLAVSVIRDTPAGVIEGFTDTVTFNGVAKPITRFLGIPFAESPTGANRFRKPVPKAKFDGVFRADKSPISCIQSTQSGVEAFSGSSNFSEDCLMLNVYVPSDFSSTPVSSSLPVMVWIYGGGFSQGGTSWYNPDVLSTVTNTIIVTLNYRVGFFGFLQSKDGSIKGNQGLWDQHLAFQWVNKNIGMFNGSPGMVTIFGESAGSVSVLYQAMYPGNKGLFQRVIAESGSPLAFWALIEPNAEKYFETVGCLTADPLTCVSTKSYSELQVSDSFIFAPTVDGDFLLESPHDVLYGDNAATQPARDFFHSLDVLTGVNNFDGAISFAYLGYSVTGFDFNNTRITRDQLRNQIFLNEVKNIVDINNVDTNTINLIADMLEFEYINWSDPDSFNTTRMAAVNFYNDKDFFMPAVKVTYAHALHATTGGTYFYEYAPKKKTHLIALPTWLEGSNHGDELMSVFGPVFDFVNVTEFTSPEESELAKIMMTMWTNFARSGNPNTPHDVTKFIHTTWPEYDMTSQQYLEFSYQMSTDSVKSRFYARRMDLWNDIIPSIVKFGQARTTTTTTPKPLPIDLSGIIGKK
ncbi:Carboxylesterase 5A [Mactra antiquata]